MEAFKSFWSEWFLTAFLSLLAFSFFAILRVFWTGFWADRKYTKRHETLLTVMKSVYLERAERDDPANYAPGGYAYHLANKRWMAIGIFSILLLFLVSALPRGTAP
jgi:hypothetical protein